MSIGNLLGQLPGEWDSVRTRYDVLEDRMARDDDPCAVSAARRSLIQAQDRFLGHLREIREAIHHPTSELKRSPLDIPALKRAFRTLAKMAEQGKALTERGNREVVDQLIGVIVLEHQRINLTTGEKPRKKDRFMLAAESAAEARQYCREHGKGESPRELWEVLRDEGCLTYTPETLPSFASWSRYERETRHIAGEETKRLTGERSGSGRSIVSINELD
ncbi:MAG: hypothetical protein KAS72_13995 [Phycisphaerales bacterium]|nr:hypothetical protein [Phycisphaerales bacterium]